MSLYIYKISITSCLDIFFFSTYWIESWLYVKKKKNCASKCTTLTAEKTDFAEMNEK